MINTYMFYKNLINYIYFNRIIIYMTVFWRDIKPSKNGRKTYKKRYGSKCFLLPSQLKYPICNKRTGEVNCKGLLAAHYRAALSIRRGLKPKTYSYRKITKKAKKLGKKYRCNWTKRKSKNKY